MCGIAGMFSCDQVLTGHEPYLAAMSEALSPRGPDQAGAYYHQGCALLHRRLVVVDAEGRVTHISTGALDADTMYERYKEALGV